MAIQLTTFLTQKKTKLPIDQQIALLDKLAQLLEQGYSIIDALSLLKVNQRWKEIIDYLTEKLKLGQSFDQILTDLQFDHQIVTFIYFALQHGNLTQAMQQSVRFINQQTKLIRHFKTVIRYPIVLLSFFLIVLFGINLYVYPAFLELYSTHTQPSPILLVAISLIDFIFSALYYLVIFVACLILFSLLLKNKLNTSQKIKLIHSLRFPRPMLKKYCSLMFATHFSSLLEANLSFKSSLSLIVEHKQDGFLSFYCQDILRDLNNGLSLENSLKKHRYFEDHLNRLFLTKTNHFLIKRDLSTYATLLLEQTKTKTLKIIKFVQPTIFIVIAISVIFIYLSILLPMLQLIQTI